MNATKEQTQEYLRALVASTRETSARLLGSEDKHPTLLLPFTQKGPFHAIFDLQMPADADEKQKLAGQLAFVLAQTPEIIAYVLIQECWMLLLRPGEEIPKCGIRESERRREVLLFQAGARDHEALDLPFEIIRGDGPTRLADIPEPCLPIADDGIWHNLFGKVAEPAPIPVPVFPGAKKEGP